MDRYAVQVKTETGALRSQEPQPSSPGTLSFPSLLVLSWSNVPWAPIIWIPTCSSSSMDFSIVWISERRPWNKGLHVASLSGNESGVQGLEPGRVKQEKGKINQRMCLQTGCHYGWLMFNPQDLLGILLKCILECCHAIKRESIDSSVSTSCIRHGFVGVHFCTPPGCACMSAKLVLTGTQSHGTWEVWGRKQEAHGRKAVSRKAAVWWYLREATKSAETVHRNSGWRGRLRGFEVICKCCSVSALGQNEWFATGWWRR